MITLINLPYNYFKYNNFAVTDKYKRTKQCENEKCHLLHVTNDENEGTQRGRRYI